MKVNIDNLIEEICVIEISALYDFYEERLADFSPQQINEGNAETLKIQNRMDKLKKIMDEVTDAL